MDIFEKGQKRTDWFMHDRFGMFIHWGLYSIPARGEWVMSTDRIDRKEYERLMDEWDPADFDAHRIVRAAKSAGMRYAILTAKHHEGFCLFDSALTDYKSTNAKRGRDIVGEFTQACRDEGIKTGLYYSLLDWNHPDYPAYSDIHHPERGRDDRREESCDFDSYLEYMHSQIRELLTNYGKIDLLWLDFSYEGKTGEDWKGSQLIKMIRSLQPDILVNSRLEASGEEFGSIVTDHPGPLAGDFATPEMMLPPFGLKTPSGKDVPWELCATMNNTWGYDPSDEQYKDAGQIIRNLVECVSKNGNLILNISPDGKGNIPFKQTAILEEIGEWMDKNSKSIYGCSAAAEQKPEWGRFTCNGNRLYAHILDLPMGPIPLPGLQGRIKEAKRLSDGHRMIVEKPWSAKYYEDTAFMNYGQPGQWTFSSEYESGDVIDPHSTP